SRMVSDLVELGVAVVEPPGAARPGANRRNITDIAGRQPGGEAPRRPSRHDRDRDQTGGGRREPAPSMPPSDGLTTGINSAQSAGAGTRADPTGVPGDSGLSRPASAVSRRPGGSGQLNEALAPSNGRGLHIPNGNGNGSNGNGSNGNGAVGVGVATPAGGNH